MPNVAELITEHVTLTLGWADWLYLNAYVPQLQIEGGVVAFLRHRGQVIPWPAGFGHITDGFRAKLRAWRHAQRIPPDRASGG